MKKLLLMLACVLLITACQPKAPSTSATTTTTTTTTATAKSTSDTVKYAYVIPKPDNWIIDSTTNNVQLFLNALKGYETGDTARIHKYFADSVEFNYDGGQYKGPIKGFLENCRMVKDSSRSLVIKMTDWEQVFSKDRTEEWVTAWYNEYRTDLKGKTDSMGVVNDALFKNSKIVRLDEYTRNLKK